MFLIVGKRARCREREILGEQSIGLSGAAVFLLDYLDFLLEIGGLVDIFWGDSVSYYIARVYY